MPLNFRKENRIQISRVALSLLMWATLSYAQGSVGLVVIANNCNVPVFFQSVGTDAAPVGKIIPNEAYQEQFQLRTVFNSSTNITSYAGISIMLSPNQSISTATADDIETAFQDSTITQFEYTYDPTSPPGLWYDISNVNGYVRTNANGWNGVLPWPFQVTGLVLTSTNNQCPNISCPGGNPNGNSTCTQAYTHSHDDYVVQRCGYNNTLVLTLCNTTSSFEDPLMLSKLKSNNSFQAYCGG
jgi:hypothetical protein